MRAAVVERPGLLVLKDVPMPKVGENDILVRVRSASICNATDNHILFGTFQGYHDFYPQILGHEVSGEVVATGAQVKGVEPGERLVFYTPTGAFCEYAKTNADGLWARVPAAVPDDEAPLCEMFHGSLVETVYPSKLKDGEKVVIAGLGPMGLTTLQCVKAMAEVTVGVVDQIALRLAKARDLGADLVYDRSCCTSMEVAKQIAGDMNGVDLAILCTAVDQSKMHDLFDFAVGVLKPGGRLTGLSVEVKGLPHYVDELQLFQKQILLARSLEPDAYPQEPKARAAKEREVLQTGVHWVRDRIVNMGALVTHEVALDEIERGLWLCRERPDRTIKVLVRVAI